MILVCDVDTEHWVFEEEEEERNKEKNRHHRRP